MSENHPSNEAGAPLSGEERLSALFANMVLQQTNLALTFLGKAPHPESGQPAVDLDTARIFIDQLEMLEAKTKGNLDKREEHLLKQNLLVLRMAFVEASQTPRAAPAGKSSAPSAQPGGQTAESSPPSAEESRKKFTKKY